MLWALARQLGEGNAVCAILQCAGLACVGGIRREGALAMSLAIPSRPAVYVDTDHCGHGLRGVGVCCLSCDGSAQVAGKATRLGQYQ